MSTTTNPESVLYQLRKLMPRRPLTQFEAYRIAELQANRLLRTSDVNQPGTPDELVTGQPFLEVQLRGDLPISGLTNWYKPRWLIILNSSEPAVRRRFSLMHEFKHIVDHGLAERAYPTTRWQRSEDRAELVADYFAACLLMPKRLVKQRFFQGLRDASELAAEFGVSPQAMRYRLQQLRLVERTPRCDYPLRPTTDLSGYFRRASAMEFAA
jgi:predicted transcriptional regulator